MNRIALIGCSKRKRRGIGPARFIYASRHFAVALAYGALVADEVLILSTKYGLISPEDRIESYDETFSTSQLAVTPFSRPSVDPREWSNQVAAQLRERGDEHRISVAGSQYVRYLRGMVEIHEEPCLHMKLATRTAWMLDELRRQKRG